MQFTGSSREKVDYEAQKRQIIKISNVKAVLK